MIPIIRSGGTYQEDDTEFDQTMLAFTGRRSRRHCGGIIAYVASRLLSTQAAPPGHSISALVASIGKDAPGRMIHDSVLTTIGNTPIVRLSDKLKAEYGVPDAVNLFAKVEALNPGGSVKDRLALGVLEWAEQNGKLKPGQTVVEASSGNTGIGLAVACAAKGYPFVCVMAESFSIERRKLMRFLGAKVVLTNPAHKGSGMVIKAKELAEEHGFFLPQQFENEANAWVHEQTTGPEILGAFAAAGEPLDYLVCAYGTGGTLKGVGSYLRKASPSTKIVVCEPDNAPLLYSGIKTEYGRAGEKKLKGGEGEGVGSGGTTFKEPHPVWRPHLLQGWATDFIPRLVNGAVDQGLVDEVRHVAGADAVNCARTLARCEGIASGTSGGGTLAGALALARAIGEGNEVSTKQMRRAFMSKDEKVKTNVLVMLADGAERYLSTPLFDGIPADMTDEERELAASTPSNAPPPITMPEVTPEAVAFVEAANAADEVVIWSLEYCEFCWTIVKLFNAIGVKHRVINIDAFEHAKDNMGNKYRAALSSATDCNTFPQCFIGGKFMGGAADACIKWKSGELQQLFDAAGVAYKKADDDESYEGDAFEFLPKWMSQNPLRSK